MGDEDGTVTAVLIRHADVTPGAGDDPDLNAASLARAQELRHVLADAGLTAIFVTSFQRSRQTAGPLAADLGTEPAIVDETALVVAVLRDLPASSVALVVGHSDSLPAIVAGLNGPPIPEIGEAEFDHLYVLTGRLTHLRYGA